MKTLFPCDVPAVLAVAQVAEQAISAVEAVIASMSAPSQDARNEAVRLAIMGSPSGCVWYARSSACWRPSAEDMGKLWGLLGAAEKAVFAAVMPLRGGGIGDCPVGADRDGVIWFYQVVQSAAMAIVRARLGDARPGVDPAARLSEVARALDAIVSLGISPADTHDFAITELRRVGLSAVADMADAA